MALCQLQITTALDGDLKGHKFTTSTLWRGNVVPLAPTIKPWLKSLIPILQPVFLSRVLIYSLTLTPIAAPERHKKVRGDHTTEYANAFGTHGTGEEVDPGILVTSAIFIKNVDGGHAGTMELRGTLTEAELRSNNDGLPVNSDQNEAGAANLRFRTFATQFFGAMDNLGGGKIVMPGPKKKADGTLVTLADYERNARIVTDIEFDGFVIRQLSKTTVSLEQAENNLCRAKVNQLRSKYNNALDDANFVESAIPADLMAELRDLGHEIFRQFSASVRQRCNIDVNLRAFIK